MKTISIGRSSDCDIVIRHDRISREHAVIIVDQANEFYIEDRGSTNGTFVNGVKIYTKTQIRKGDKINFAKKIDFSWEEHFSEYLRDSKLNTVRNNTMSQTNNIGKTSTFQLEKKESHPIKSVANIPKKSFSSSPSIKRTNSNSRNTIRKPIDPKKFELASKGERFSAWIIDIFLLYIPIFLFALMVEYESEQTTSLAILLLSLTLFIIVVQVIFTALHGQSIGKRMLNLFVVNMDDHQNKGIIINVILRKFINYMPAVLIVSMPGAEIIQTIVALFSIIWAVDALFIFQNEQRQCLHDKFASTVVIKKKKFFD